MFVCFEKSNPKPISTSRFYFQLMSPRGSIASRVDKSSVKFFLSILKGANQRDSSRPTSYPWKYANCCNTFETPLAAMLRVLLIAEERTLIFFKLLIVTNTHRSNHKIVETRQLALAWKRFRTRFDWKYDGPSSSVTKCHEGRSRISWKLLFSSANFAALCICTL